MNKKIIHKNGDKYIGHDISSLSPDVVASKLVNDPLYGGLVSSDTEQTKTAITYLYVFLAIPILVACSIMHDKFGQFGFGFYLFFLCVCIAIGRIGMILSFVMSLLVILA